MNLRHLIVIIVIGSIPSFSFGQISPGKLSSMHESLEGVDNCTKCHETGKEITGKKCLDCHTEIRDVIAARHGYHFQNASTACIDCHKEHLGREAKITQFDKKTFDHRKTGYALTGKHASLACETCHNAAKIKDPAIAKLLKQYSHTTYLGLQQQCLDCHTNRHANSLGPACQNCHTSDGWKPAAAFSHAKTKYPLIGKHGTTACVQCHESLKTSDATRPLLFSVKSYEDCKACHQSPHDKTMSRQVCRTCHTPAGWKVLTGFDHRKTDYALMGKHETVACVKCHAGLANVVKGAKVLLTTKPFHDCSPCHLSPHAASFSKKSCMSCHTPQQWSSVPEIKFDHNLTSFKLRGKHAALECSKCHGTSGSLSFKNKFKLTKTRCIDCHEDKHNGQFLRVYANDCSKCHSENGYSPSTFTIEQHGKIKFPLTNAHLTVPCKECHVKQQETKFHFDMQTCGSCHKDRHEGRFAEFMKGKSCDACHETLSWKKIEFDHAQTSFPLIGQHRSVDCQKCHAKGYKGTGKECSDCHTDPHAGQFIDKGKTDCARCHTPIGRRALVFRHDVQSVFALTGAHTKVECGACHKPEMRNNKLIVRYKPLSTTCESCHRGKI